MSRYRKIEVKTWADAKFRALSTIPPCAQGLWFFLLTGSHTNQIPGLFRAGRAGMAEELNWSLEAFTEAFREVSEQGMAKADFDARLVWLPRALRHNKPESPNVVRSWRSELDLMPECDLKFEAMAAIRAQLSEYGEPYVTAFDEVSGPLTPTHVKPSAKPLRKASPNTSPNQEQEQEQDKSPPKPPQGGSKRDRGITLRAFLADCQQRGVEPIPPDDAVWGYPESMGFPAGWIDLAWWAFQGRHLAAPGESARRQTSWRQAFRNAVRENWLKLWWADGSGYRLTTSGVQAQREMERAT